MTGVTPNVAARIAFFRSIESGFRYQVHIPADHEHRFRFNVNRNLFFLWDFVIKVLLLGKAEIRGEARL